MYNIVHAWRNRKYLDGSHQRECVRCGSGNAEPAHYTGVRQGAFGKGRGIKCSDFAIADLCHDCHQKFDDYSISVPELAVAEESLSSREFNYIRKVFISEEFLYYVFLTLHRRLEEGEIIVS